MLFYKERFMEVKIVLGLLWGDCGKGNTVQWLCKKALEEGKKPCVVRFSGGPQAGHTVVHNGITHVCSSFGSGVLLGVPTVYVGGLIDPLCVENERKVLESKGVEAKIYAMDDIPLITPYDVYDQQQWAKKHPNHTCGKGVYSAVLRMEGMDNNDENVPPITVSDLCSSKWLDKMLTEVRDYYKSPEINTEVLKEWRKAALKFRESNKYMNLQRDFDVLILEGTQGLLLDPECGFYPFTTSTKVGLNGVPEEFLEDAEVYLVTRTYLTRHGEMSHFDRKFIIGRKRNLDIPEGKLETNTFNEFQGEFRVAPMDCLPVEMAVYRHHLDNYQKRYKMKFNLAVTHMDVLDLYPAMSTKEVAFAISMTLVDAGLKLSDVYGAYGPDSNFKLLRSYDN